MMNLAVALSLRWEKRVVAQALSLPLSTVYRWLALYQFDPARFERADRMRHIDWLHQAIGECRDCGFDIEGSLRAIEPGLVPVGDTRHTEAQDQFESSRRGDSPGRQTLARVVTSADAAVGNAHASRRSEAIMEFVRKKIDAHYYSKLSCEMLASSMGMSKWHFIRMFKAAFGISPYQYLTYVRIQRAKYLLRTTPHPLEAVAAAVGFDTLSCFCRAFRKIEGLSLSSFSRDRRMEYMTPAAAGPIKRRLMAG